jgi:hypothetical protein
VDRVFLLKDYCKAFELILLTCLTFGDILERDLSFPWRITIVGDVILQEPVGRN